MNATASSRLARDAGERLAFLLARTNHLYRAYRANPIYRRAKLVYGTNVRIISLLYDQGHLFGDQEAVQIALDHFEIWRDQFSEAGASATMDEEFIFPRCSIATRYPTAELAKLTGAEAP